jgi:hypothetical protein
MVHAPRETHQAQQLQQLEPAAATVQAHVALRHTGLYDPVSRVKYQNNKRTANLAQPGATTNL